MSTKPQMSPFTAQTATVETFLTLARIHLTSTERLSALALDTVRANFDDCATAARTAGTMNGSRDPSAFITTLGKPMLERTLAYSRSVMEIFVQAQSEVQQVVANGFGTSGFRLPMAQDWNSGVEMFTRGVRELSTMTANNVATATDAGAKLADSIQAAGKKVA